MFTVFVIGKSQFFTLWFEKTRVLIGRSLDNDVVLSDLTVSRRHCLVHAEPQCFTIEDLKSANGCYLNGYILVGRARALEHAELRIGIYVIYILVGRVELGSCIVQPVPPADPSDEAMALRRAQRLARKSAATTERASFQPTSPFGRAPTLASLRWLLNQVLVSASDLDAFCLDHFKHIRSRFDGGLDRVSKVTLLFERAHPAEILQRLREDYPELVKQYEAYLCYEDC